MDPDATLADILAICHSPADYGDDGAERLPELIIALDQWIKRGGFLPKAWANSVDPRD